MPTAWIGVDTGKAHHWAVAVDADGQVLLSQRVANDQAAIAELIGQASGLADELTWAVDLSNCYAALLLGLLWDADQPVVYLPGKAVNRAADAYRSEAKTDARDARVIADQARMRRDLAPLTPSGELLAELRLLITHRRDLVTDRTRMIARLREHLTASFPALERRLELTRTGPLVLLCGYQTPSTIRAAGQQTIAAWLRGRKVLKADALAATATAAAAAQTVRLPAEQLTAQLVAELAGAVLEVTQRIKALDKTLTTRLEHHPKATILTSLPGMGTLLAAEFLVAVGDLAAFANPDHLAAYAGLTPVPRESGKRTGGLYRPQRYNRALLRVLYTSALISKQRPGPSRVYYQRKRAEGKRHIQAVLALARRRVNVLWAMLRDHRVFTLDPPIAEEAA